MILKQGSGRHDVQRSHHSCHSMQVRILAPLHCSTSQHLIESCLRREPDRCAVSTQLIIPVACSDDRIFWRGVFPLFFDEHSIASKAVAVFLDSFHPQPFLEPAQLRTQTDLYLQVQHIVPLYFTTSNRSKQLNRKKTRDSPIHLTILLLPPYPSPVPSRSLRPEKIFTFSLVRWENRLIQLQSVNAYIATLGGGFFLCRYLSQAVQLARMQRQVALALGDASLASKCTLNEAYNYIHAGRIHTANVMIRKTKKEAKARKDLVVISMCDSALWFSRQVALAHCENGHDSVQNAEKALSKGQVGGLNHLHKQSAVDQQPLTERTKWTALPSVSKTVDDYLRIRIVQT